MHVVDGDWESIVSLRETIARRFATIACFGADAMLLAMSRVALTLRAADPSMAINHSRMLDVEPSYHVTAEEITNGACITVTAKQPSDARTVAEIRGLGIAGLIPATARRESPHAPL